jgi:hypothetical protein
MEHFYQNIGENWFSYPGLYSVMVREFPSGSHFVEVGSWRGRSAAYMAVEIINSGKSILFDCVDTWNGSQEHLDPSSGWFVKELIEDPDYLWKDFNNNISPVKEVIKPIRMTSLEASQLYEDESLDFVFIDASHEYQDVLDDITSWIKKVKIGGVLAGHDISYYEVQNAVAEYSKNFGISITPHIKEDIWFYEKR